MLEIQLPWAPFYSFWNLCPKEIYTTEVFVLHFINSCLLQHPRQFHALEFDFGYL